MSRPFMLMLAASLLLLCGAIQVHHFVGTLRVLTGDQHLLVADGDRLVLRPAEPQTERGRINPRFSWHVSAPYLQTPDGRYLARQPEPNGAQITVSSKRSDDARWAIEIVEKIRPRHPERGSRDEIRMLVGQAGARIRLSAFDGPQRGQYLALSGDAKEARFTLVTDVRQALVLEYIEHVFAIDHR